ncbi:MAG: hypothetical protein LAP13_00535 [Acidobacteriia bacterium]|nr:hypothetical protein [Terriglobia bacterium]
MPALVIHLIQLRDGILALRKERGDFLAHLQLENDNRRASVADLLSHFSSGLHDMARRSKANREAFLSNLQEAVAALRRGVRIDLGGGRMALDRLRRAPAARDLQAPGPRKSEPEALAPETRRVPKPEASEEQPPAAPSGVPAAETEKPKGGTRRKRRKS